MAGKYWYTFAVVAMTASLAWADPPFPIDSDLDGNGQSETEGSSAEFYLSDYVMAGMDYTVTFDIAFLSSEGFEDVHDVFLIRVVNGEDESILGTPITGAVVVGDPNSYTGSFTPWDTINGTIGGADHSASQIPGPASAPAGGEGLMFPAFFSDAGIGWVSDFSISFSGTDADVFIEFLVADSEDTAADSGLALDNLRLWKELPDSAPQLLFSEGFEDPNSVYLTSESFGNAGIYQSLPIPETFEGGGGEGDLPDTFLQSPLQLHALVPSEGSYFGLISTSNVPEPTSVALLAIAAAAVVRRRR